MVADSAATPADSDVMPPDSDAVVPDCDAAAPDCDVTVPDSDVMAPDCDAVLPDCNNAVPKASKRPAISLRVLKPTPPADTRLWAAIQNASGGSWGGWVYDADRIAALLAKGLAAERTEGSEARGSDGTVDWIMQQNSAARLRNSLKRAGVSPGSSDLLTQVAWYREFSPDESKAWLVVDKPSDPAVFSSFRAYRVFSGGFVRHKEDAVFHLPFSSIDCANGASEPLELDVPLTGTVSLPETNIQSSEDGSSYHTWGPFLLGITRLRIDEDQLAITVASTSSATELTFDLGELR